MRKTAAAVLCAALALAASRPPLTPEQRATHVLNRLTFGARPGDVEKVRELGIERWIEQQLHPDTIVENPELDRRRAPLDSLRMSAQEMLQHYPARQQIVAMSRGLMPLPEDPLARAAAQNAMQRVKKNAAANDNDAAATVAADDTPAVPPPAPSLGRPAERAATLASLTPAELATALEAIPQGQRIRLAAAATPELRRRIEILSAPLQLVQRDLVSGKILRAAYSDRQLEEVLVDFWYNHFNVFLDKGADRDLVTSYERDVIRPHVLGKFKDLLVATAQSPAMLFYLDNWQSTGPDAPAAGNKKRGLNENYGRELLELHTMGVDGGYSQRDVTEVARCFTGWTLRAPRAGATFFFNPRMHDKGTKQVLGQNIERAGMDEGLRILNLLARHPATARFISQKLATRFVADDPPPALVHKMEQTFLKTDGDLREVMRTMLSAPEFWDPANFNAKLKSPFEFVIGALRASENKIPNPPALMKVLEQLGQPLYRKQEPTGYSNRGADWMNSSSLLARLNFATTLKHPEFGAPEFQRK